MLGIEADPESGISFCLGDGGEIMASSFFFLRRSEGKPGGGAVADCNSSPSQINMQIIGN